MDISTGPSGPSWPCPQLPQRVLWVVCLAKLRPDAGAWQPGTQGSTLPSSPWESPLTWEGCSEVPVSQSGRCRPRGGRHGLWATAREHDQWLQDWNQGLDPASLHPCRE